MIFGLIAHPLVPWVMSAVIVGTAMLLWLSFRRRLRALILAIEHATAQIEVADGQINFKKRFANIFKDVALNPVIGSFWRAYAATIEPAPGDPNILGYSRRPRESFNEAIATTAGVNLRFYQAVPNLLVGAGLLFTFLGLVGALHFAAEGVAASDVGQAQSALGALLATATFKFMTSIAGLASSIVFSWREKSQLALFEQALSRLCNALEARMVPITTQSLLAANLREMQQQTKELQRFGKQNVATVPERMEHEIRDAVAQSVAGLKPVIDATGRKLQNLDKIIAQEIEVSLEHRRAIESVPDIAEQVTDLQNDLANLASHGSEPGAPSSEGPSSIEASNPEPAAQSSGNGSVKLSQAERDPTPPSWMQRVFSKKGTGGLADNRSRNTEP